MAIATRPYQNYVNGRYVDPQGGKTLMVENPATGADVSDVPDSTVDDAREAIEIADRAQRPWQKLAPIERAGYLHRIAEGIRKDAEHLARVLSEEQGKPLDQARGEVNGTADYFDYTAEWARRDRRRGHPERPAQRDAAAAPAAHRRHRRNRALELPALCPRPQGGASAPDRQRDRREARARPPRTARSSSASILAQTPTCPPVSSTSCAATDRRSRAAASNPRIGMMSVTGSIETGTRVMEPPPTTSRR